MNGINTKINVKLLLLICLIFNIEQSYTQTYYLSQSGNDANDGTSPTTAWATIERLNRVLPSISAGTTVLFERGGTYYGSMPMQSAQQGTADRPIRFGAYGSGDMPVISGARQVSNWEQISETMWVARVPSRPASIDVLYVNGKKLYTARYPNEGYLYVTDYYRNGLRDRNLDFPEGYWIGATLLNRAVDSYFLRDTVAYSYSDGRIDLFRKNHIPSTGWGYFFQNHINALDTNGEWVYDGNEGTLTLYTQDNPNEQHIEFIDADYGMEILFWKGSTPYNDRYMTIEDLCFQHFRRYAILVGESRHMTIRNNVFKNCMGALLIVCSENCVVAENTFRDLEMDGVIFGNVNHSRIHNNTFKRIGLSLEGGSGHTGTAIQLGIRSNEVHNKYNEITLNRIDSIGSCGIESTFVDNLLIKNNVVNYSMLSLRDGGGIMLSKVARDNLPQDDIRIIDNIVMNAEGSNAGTPEVNRQKYNDQFGIYLDDNAANVHIEGNTVYNCGRGIFLHGGTVNRIYRNVLFNNALANIVTMDTDIGTFLDNDLQYNYMYGNNSFSYPQSLTANMMYGIDIHIGLDDLATRNKIDNNYISAPFGTGFSHVNGRQMDRITWSSRYDFDLHSRTEPVSYVFSGASTPEEFAFLAYNPTSEVAEVKLDGTYIAFDSTVYRGSITLQPYKSAILFKYGIEDEIQDIPIGPTDLCMGTISEYRVPASLNLDEVDIITWQVIPSAAGSISVSGEKGSTATVQWQPNYLPSPVQLVYHVRTTDGKRYSSEPLLVSLEEDNGRPPSPEGPTQIATGTVSSVFTTENPTGATIQWIIPENVGELDFNPIGNSVTVKWADNLLGKYPITYRFLNSCGQWSAEAFPLYCIFPVPPPEGSTAMCEGERTEFRVIPHPDINGSLTWVLRPSSAGSLEYDNNIAWVTLNRNPGTEVVLYYTGRNSDLSQFQSPSITLVVKPLPEQPARPTGQTSINWFTSSNEYKTAETEQFSYEWQIVPATAGSLLSNGSSATVNWEGGTDHLYVGAAYISYRVSDPENSCGPSEYSPTLQVNLLPKPPETKITDPCARSDSEFTAQYYQNARSYRWNITPSNAGKANSNTSTTSIT